MVDDVAPQLLVYALVLRYVHQSLRRLVHVAFAELQQVLELTVDLFTIHDAIERIGLSQALRLETAFAAGELADLLLQNLIPLFQLRFLNLVARELLLDQCQVLVEYDLLILNGLVLFHLLGKQFYLLILPADLAVSLLQLQLQIRDQVVFLLDHSVFQFELMLEVLDLFLLARYLVLQAVLREFHAAVRLALGRLLG